MADDDFWASIYRDADGNPYVQVYGDNQVVVDELKRRHVPVGTKYTHAHTFGRPTAAELIAAIMEALDDDE